MTGYFQVSLGTAAFLSATSTTCKGPTNDARTPRQNKDTTTPPQPPQPPPRETVEGAR